jgi:hypothetical protein
MTANELAELEKRLDYAEDLFLDTRSYSRESQQIWGQLRELQARVTTERLRAEVAAHPATNQTKPGAA